ncbi:VOC family protein [Kitasatospora terrestris]|uniref:Glyoxalase-like domain-containing protein n=1 Tax=Kitasatospora terrestris TaxID=258051 RepID=A0ABP9DE12_9ACTN
MPGRHLGHEEPGTAVAAASPQGPFLARRQADGYRPPVWPPAGGAQHPMVRFGFRVGGPESAVAGAVGLGATVAGFQPQPDVRVLLDLAGHPFCLRLGVQRGAGSPGAGARGPAGRQAAVTACGSAR